MSGRLLDADREALARIIETTVGLGVAAVPGCNLCGRNIPCPAHVGIAAAEDLATAVQAIVTRAADKALADAADALDAAARGGTAYNAAAQLVRRRRIT